MVKLKHLIRYIVDNYPYKAELSNARLTKLVYLADWYGVLIKGRQLTEIEWQFNHYGPYVDDVINEVKEDPYMRITKTKTAYGNEKQLIEMKMSVLSNFFKSELDEDTKVILNKVIEDTKLLYWQDFISYIYETYPIINSERYDILDLESLGKECKEKGIKI